MATSTPTSAPVIPADDLLRSCVHCGFCLSGCPTYRLTGDEADSPRGRLYFMRAISEGTIALTANVEEHLNRCVLCRACETACPAGVEFGRLLERGRAIAADVRGRVWWSRLLRRVFFGGVFPYPERLRRLMALTRWYQRSGLQALVRRFGLLRLVPGEWALREAQLPPLPEHGFRAAATAVYRPPGEPTARVALFTGCVQDEVHGHVHAATVRVLLAFGCEVHVPEAQRCCGALQVHAGEPAAARQLAQANVAAFETGEWDVVLNNAAGCGAALKEMAGWFPADDPWHARAARVAARVRDISEFLAELAPPRDWRPVPRRVAYDDPCHLIHGQHITAQPRALLERIPQLEVVTVPESDVCCGAGGIYSLTHPAWAAEIGAAKIRRILETTPDMVATGNPGCMLQIAAGLRTAGQAIPVVHLIELLDEALGGPRAGTGMPRV